MALGALREVGDGARQPPPIDLARIVAGDEHRARIGALEPTQNAHQRRLSRPVGPDQPDHLARRHVDRDAIENGATALRHRDRLGADHAHVSALRVRRSSAKKNGAPISAVTTPSRSSGPHHHNRTAESAAKVNAAPPSALGSNRREG